MDTLRHATHGLRQLLDLCINPRPSSALAGGSPPAAPQKALSRHSDPHGYPQRPQSSSDPCRVHVRAGARVRARDRCLISRDRVRVRVRVKARVRAKLGVRVRVRSLYRTTQAEVQPRAAGVAPVGASTSNAGCAWGGRFGKSRQVQGKDEGDNTSTPSAPSP